jgi:hypothetical protein
MRQTLRNKKMKKTKNKKMKKRITKYKGGTYYSYNKNPLRFTSSTTQMGGAITQNTANTLLPQGLVNIGRSAMFNSSSNAFKGFYPGVNPDPSVQPINKIIY